MNAFVFLKLHCIAFTFSLFIDSTRYYSADQHKSRLSKWKRLEHLKRKQQLSMLFVHWTHRKDKADRFCCSLCERFGVDLSLSHFMCVRRKRGLKWELIKLISFTKEWIRPISTRRQKIWGSRKVKTSHSNNAKILKLDGYNTKERVFSFDRFFSYSNLTFTNVSVECYLMTFWSIEILATINKEQNEMN